MGELDRPRLGIWQWLGRVPYRDALALQAAHRDRVIEGRDHECLFLLEHPPVITLGRSADPSHVLADPSRLSQDGIAIVPTSRGGDVTFHGPGQLVGYPVFRLGKGLRAHMETMAAAIQDVLGAYGIPATWRPDRPGLWVGNAKLCAFGVHVRARVAMHGFALNVQDLRAGFSRIVPCGLADADVGSMAGVLGRAPPVHEVARAMPAAFARRFGFPLAEHGVAGVAAGMPAELSAQ